MKEKKNPPSLHPPSSVVWSRLSRRTVRLLVGLLLPFVFLRSALLVLESASLCSPTIRCITWRILGGSDADLLREDLTKALLEATTTNDVDDWGRVGIGTAEAANYKDLVQDMATNRQDIKAFAFKTKAMMAKMEYMVKRAKWQESINWYLAAHGVPKSLHCLTLKLAEEYAVNAAARSSLPPPQYVYHLTDPSLHHIVLLMDNVLAASVVVSTAVKTASNPGRLVFHVVTDKKTYAGMHAWFAMNPVNSAVVEVKGLHQFDLPREVNMAIKQMLEIHSHIWERKNQYLKKIDVHGEEDDHKLNVLSPSYTSLLYHLRIYLPELFPDLNKVVFLDHDVVVQHDLSSLWDLDLHQNVLGAVVDSRCEPECCPGRKFADYFNFTDPRISSSVDPDRCRWLFGVNIFDLERWRKTNITLSYQQWLKLSLSSGSALWHPGAFQPSLLAFENHLHRIAPTWELDGLGERYPRLDKYKLESAGVLHYSGPAKPWLEIGSPEVRGLWYKHVNLSNKHIRRCGVSG